MRPALDNPALFHQEDQIGATDRGKPVRDHERRAVRQQIRHGGLNELLALGIEIARRFVENQDLRPGEDRARDRQALLLAAREFDAAFADRRLISLR